MQFLIYLQHHVSELVGFSGHDQSGSDAASQAVEGEVDQVVDVVLGLAELSVAYGHCKSACLVFFCWDVGEGLSCRALVNR